MSLLIAFRYRRWCCLPSRRCCPGSFASPARGCITAAGPGVLQEYRDILNLLGPPERRS
ncbi:hypothetical protein MJ560_22120 [Klebsiella pneumoniae]|nr:hypothetical protein MJ560_22120 [Klebsiella pneumoniae]